MRDLISRSEVIKLLQKNMSNDIQDQITTENNINLIESLPTAFDTEKVVEKLKGLSNAEADYYYAKSNDVIDREDAIDIVKKGGVE